VIEPACLINVEEQRGVEERVSTMRILFSTMSIERWRILEEVDAAGRDLDGEALAQAERGELAHEVAHPDTLRDTERYLGVGNMTP
jgi:hypothetical protein